MQIEKRIEKLEQSINQPSIQIVLCEKGETNQQAIKRLGIIDNGNIIFVHFVSP